VAIVGPPGIGKSRLADAFLRRVAALGLPLHRGYCESYLGARPLQPFEQLLRSILAAEPGLALEDGAAVSAHLQRVCGAQAETLLHLLARHAGKEEQPPADAVALALVPLLARLGANALPTLYIDDWQWADDASRQTLALLAANLPCPLLLILATRTIDPLLAEMRVTLLPVPPLSTAEASAAIVSLLSAPDPFLVEHLVQSAGGNPLFVEELCHAQLSGRDTQVRGDRDAWLAMMIQARFSQLPLRLAELVRTAAVIGHIIPTWLFEAITRLRADDPRVQKLAEEDFLYPGEVAGTLRFKHGITREAIYPIVGMRTRKALHRRVVAALLAHARETGEEEQLEMLAYHYEAAGNTTMAYAYALRAGDRAMDAGALDIAQAQYRAAFDAVAALANAPKWVPEVNGVIRRFGLSCVVDPAPDQLLVFARMADLAQSAHNHEGVTLARYWLGAINYGLGEPRPSIAHLEQALESALTLGNPRLIAQIRASLGQSLFAAGACAVAAEALDEAIAGLRVKKSARLSTGLAYALCCRGFLLADQGHFDAARPYYEEVEKMLSGAEPPMLGSYHTQMAAVALWAGEHARAIDHGERGMRISERTRTRYIFMMSRALAAYGRWCIDPDPVAVDDLVQATNWFLSGASQQRSSLCFGWLAEIMAETGQPERARFYAAWALRRARKGDRMGEAMACRAMARLAARGVGARSPDHYIAIAYRSGEARLSPREQALTRRCEVEIAARARENVKPAARAAPPPD
jgi:tetratricopeptide (TPR) repeat protein